MGRELPLTARPPEPTNERVANDTRTSDASAVALIFGDATLGTVGMVNRA